MHTRCRPATLRGGHYPRDPRYPSISSHGISNSRYANRSNAVQLMVTVTMPCERHVWSREYPIHIPTYNSARTAHICKCKLCETFGIRKKISTRKSIIVPIDETNEWFAVIQRSTLRNNRPLDLCYRVGGPQSSLGVEVCTRDGNGRRGECSTDTHRREPFASFRIECLTHLCHSLKAQL